KTPDMYAATVRTGIGLRSRYSVTSRADGLMLSTSAKPKNGGSTLTAAGTSFGISGGRRRHPRRRSPRKSTHIPPRCQHRSAPCYITSGNGGCTALLISLLIFAITLFFILWRPRGIREAWFAAGGAALMGAAGFVGWSDVARLWAETGDVLAFLAGMLVVGYV